MGRNAPVISVQLPAKSSRPRVTAFRGTRALENYRVADRRSSEKRRYRRSANAFTFLVGVRCCGLTSCSGSTAQVPCGNSSWTNPLCSSTAKNRQRLPRCAVT